MLVEGADDPTAAELPVLGGGPIDVDVELHRAPPGQVGQPEEQPAATGPRAGIVDDQPAARDRAVQQVGEDAERVAQVHDPAVRPVRDPGGQPASAATS